jgi:hypothetical protein
MTFFYAIPSALLAAVLLFTFEVRPESIHGNSPDRLTLLVPHDPVNLSCAPPAESAPVLEKTLRRTFFEDFSNFLLPSRRWETNYGDDACSRYPTVARNRCERHSRTHYDSPNENQVYVDPDFPGTSRKPLGLNPFNLKNGVLSISAQTTPIDLREHLYGLPFTSGMISTRRSFTQLYGYFEISARFSRAKGAWPAFWLLQPGGWPPEIDVFEGMDSDAPSQILVTSHWRDPNSGQHEFSYCRVEVTDPDQRFHRYGVLWLPDRIVHYFDGKAVNELQTPPGLDSPMYMIANLAVTHALDETTAPVSMDIGWIAAYSVDP